MTGVDPAVETPGEGIGHAVGILMPEHTVQNLAMIRVAVAIGIADQEDVGNTMHQRRVCRGQGQQPDGDVQSIGKGRDRSGFTIGSEVRQDLHGVARLRPVLGGVGILDRIRDPEPPAVVKGEVQRLLDIRLSGHELDLETRRDMKCLALVFGCAMRKFRDILHGRGLLGKSRS